MTTAAARTRLVPGQYGNLEKVTTLRTSPMRAMLGCFRRHRGASLLASWAALDDDPPLLCDCDTDCTC